MALGSGVKNPDYNKREVKNPFVGPRYTSKHQYPKSNLEADIEPATWDIPHLYGEESDTLFEQTSPRTLWVHDLAADPNMEHTIPNLLALAMHRTGSQQFGASDSLSKHSSKLVKNAIARGLPVVTDNLNPDADVTNDIEKRPFTFYGDPNAPEHHYHEMDDVEMNRARHTLRSMLKRPTKTHEVAPASPKPLSGQFASQDTPLPGMEKFV